MLVLCGRVRVLRAWRGAARRRTLLRRCHAALAARNAELTLRSLLATWRAACASQREKAAKLHRAVLQLQGRTTGAVFRQWAARYACITSGSPQIPFNMCGLNCSGGYQVSFLMT